MHWHEISKRAVIHLFDSMPDFQTSDSPAKATPIGKILSITLGTAIAFLNVVVLGIIGL